MYFPYTGIVRFIGYLFIQIVSLVRWITMPERNERLYGVLCALLVERAERASYAEMC